MGNKLKIIILLLISIVLSDNCTDISACNYNPNAESDDGSCYYPIECPNNSLECNVEDCSYPDGFEWNQSTKILFLFVDYAYKHNSNFSLSKYEDWIGAFKEYDETKNGLCETISDNCPDINFDGILTENVEVCVGSKYWNGDNNTEIPLMAYQSNNYLTNGYLEPGDSPYFKLFDSDTDSLYFMIPFKDGEEYNLSYQGNSSIDIVVIDSLVSQCPFYNNLDSDQDSLPDTCDACPNDPNNDIDGDNICFPSDLCPYDSQNDTDGDGICACTIGDLLDCQEIIDNDPLVNGFDDCPFDIDNDIDDDGICGNLDDCPNDPTNSDIDNDGICDDIDDCIGIFDDCGVCNGNNINKDCNGDCFGEAFIDYCGICVEGNTSFNEGFLNLGCGCYNDEPLEYCYDSDGDELGNPGTQEYYCIEESNNSDYDILPDNWFLNCEDSCINDIDNDADNDGICGDIDQYPDCYFNFYDCFGECGGEAIIDDCGQCSGNNYDQCDFDNDGIINIEDSCPNDSENDTDGDGICGDIDECPYDSDNDIDQDNICGDVDQYPDCYFNFYDCFGECGGEALIDDCGICGGTGNCQCPDYEYGIIPDCNGVCGGEALIDDCGICNGGNINKDCAGECFGLAVLDDCGICSGGTSNHVVNSDQDCYGDCFGSAFVDTCGVCSEGNSGHIADSDIDCNGDCFGEALIDDCGICSDGNTDHQFNSDIDCNGDCFGTAFLDDCEVCSGGNTSHEANSDIDCNGDCFGEALIDDCGICSDGNTDHQFNSDIDCNGNCFGDGIDIDNDNICDEIDECIGEYDPCGICNGDGTWCLSADIYFGYLNNNQLEIMYDSPLDIGGFQFSIYGLDIINAYGGHSEEFNFNIVNNNNTVLGFSLVGDSISAGSGLLVTLSVNYINLQACLDNVVISDNDGDQINANLGSCLDIPCYDSDMDTICDEADDCFGTVDECGICNGNGIDEGECDCDGNILDCNDICGGGDIIDDCGICGGNNINQDCNQDCFGEAFIDYCGNCVGGNTQFEEGYLDPDNDNICGGDDDCPYDFDNDIDDDGICGDIDICPNDPENDADGDGVCESEEIFGCNDIIACNYNPLSTENDGSCIYFNFTNLIPENNEVFLVDNQNIDDMILFQWEIPPSECDYIGNYRLYILDENFNPVFFTISNDNFISIDYQDLQIEDSTINYYNWNVEAIDTDFESDYSQFIIDSEFLENNFDSIPENFFISDIFPNPFNPQTSFSYGVPYPASVDISIYNSVGQIVYKLNKKYHNPGTYSFIWNPSGLTSGVYYIQLKSGNNVINKKTTYIK